MLSIGSGPGDVTWGSGWCGNKVSLSPKQVFGDLVMSYVFLPQPNHLTIHNSDFNYCEQSIKTIKYIVRSTRLSWFLHANPCVFTSQLILEVLYPP